MENSVVESQGEYVGLTSHPAGRWLITNAKGTIRVRVNYMKTG
jgi:hypothetical protein